MKEAEVHFHSCREGNEKGGREGERDICMLSGWDKKRKEKELAHTVLHVYAGAVV